MLHRGMSMRCVVHRRCCRLIASITSILSLLFTSSPTPSSSPPPLLVEGQSLFELRPGWPGLDGFKHSPRNSICPKLVFEPRSPKLSMRYGPFTLYNGETQTPTEASDTVEACGNTVRLEEDGTFGSTEGPSTSPYQITQIIESPQVPDYIERALWVCWKSPKAARVVVTTSLRYTRLSIHASCGCSPATAPLIGCVDGRDPDGAGAHYSKRLVFDAESERDYLVRVGVVAGSSEEDGTIQFDIQEEEE